MSSRDQQEGGSDTLFCQIMVFCLGSWCALPGSRSAAELPNLSLLPQEVALSRFGPK